MNWGFTLAIQTQNHRVMRAFNPLNLCILFPIVPQPRKVNTSPRKRSVSGIPHRLGIGRTSDTISSSSMMAWEQLKEGDQCGAMERTRLRTPQHIGVFGVDVIGETFLEFVFTPLPVTIAFRLDPFTPLQCLGVGA